MPLQDLHYALRHLRKTPGFDPAHIAALEIDPSPSRCQGRDVLASFYALLLDRISHLPGIAGASIINAVPLQTPSINSDIHIKGQPFYPPSQEMLAKFRIVSPGNFATLQSRLLRGRLLNPTLDTPDRSYPSIAVNQSFLNKFIPAGLDPIGQYIDDGNAEIVGVVSDLRQNLDEKPLTETDYLDSGVPVKDHQSILVSMNLLVRTPGGPRAVYGELHPAHPTIPFRAPETMTEIIADQLSFTRMESWLFGMFAALALLLSVVGVCGLITHEVELGMRDIGIRMALGASRLRVLWTVLSRTTLVIAAGLVLGCALALVAKSGIGSIVPLAYARDAVTLLVAALVLLLAGVAAALPPARRAAIIHPSQALRNA